MPENAGNLPKNADNTPKMPETVEVDHKTAETRPKLCKMRISSLGRILPILPVKIIAGKQPK